jgi:ribosomal protein L18E
MFYHVKRRYGADNRQSRYTDSHTNIRLKQLNAVYFFSACHTEMSRLVIKRLSGKSKRSRDDHSISKIESGFPLTKIKNL